MKYWLGTGAVIALAGGWLWLVTPGKPVAADQVVADDTPAQSRLPSRAQPLSANAKVQAEDENPAGATDLSNEAVPAPPRSASLASWAEPPAGPEPASGLTPMTVMENVRSTFRNYSARFGGNPVGTNQEISRTLNGANPGGITFLQSEDGLLLSEQGELVDNWGTPFFFHQLSRTEIEIHSAGPDRKMWTSDDLVMR